MMIITYTAPILVILDWESFHRERKKKKETHNSVSEQD